MSRRGDGGMPRASIMADELGRAPRRASRFRCTVRNRVRAFSEGEGLSIVDLADVAGLSPATVRRMMQPHSNPRLSSAVAVCNAFGRVVEAVYFLGGEGNT